MAHKAAPPTDGGTALSRKYTLLISRPERLDQQRCTVIVSSAGIALAAQANAMLGWSTTALPRARTTLTYRTGLKEEFTTLECGQGERESGGYCGCTQGSTDFVNS